MQNNNGSSVSTGRTLAIGDIHGCDTALDVLLSMIQPRESDCIIVLGDVVDRGPGTKQAVEKLLELQQRCRLIFLLGNHEEMMLEAMATGNQRQEWLLYGGRRTLQSYGGDFDQIPREHVEFLQSGLPYWESESEIFVHACLEPGKPLDEQTSEWLRWRRLTSEVVPHPSGKRVVCGHTSLVKGIPVTLNGWVCIDTCAYGGGFLTCLDVVSNTVYQAQESGESRVLPLS